MCHLDPNNFFIFGTMAEPPAIANTDMKHSIGPSSANEEKKDDSPATGLPELDDASVDTVWKWFCSTSSNLKRKESTAVPPSQKEIDQQLEQPKIRVRTQPLLDGVLIPSSPLANAILERARAFRSLSVLSLLLRSNHRFETPWKAVSLFLKELIQRPTNTIEWTLYLAEVEVFWRESLQHFSTLSLPNRSMDESGDDQQSLSPAHFILKDWIPTILNQKCNNPHSKCRVLASLFRMLSSFPSRQVLSDALDLVFCANQSVRKVALLPLALQLKHTTNLLRKQDWVVCLEQCEAIVTVAEQIHQTKEGAKAAAAADENLAFHLMVLLLQQSSCHNNLPSAWKSDCLRYLIRILHITQATTEGTGFQQIKRALDQTILASEVLHDFLQIILELQKAKAEWKDTIILELLLLLSQYGDTDEGATAKRSEMLWAFLHQIANCEMGSLSPKGEWDESVIKACNYLGTGNFGEATKQQRKMSRVGLVVYHMIARPSSTTAIPYETTWIRMLQQWSSNQHHKLPVLATLVAFLSECSEALRIQWNRDILGLWIRQNYNDADGNVREGDISLSANALFIVHRFLFGGNQNSKSINGNAAYIQFWIHSLRSSTIRPHVLANIVESLLPIPSLRTTLFQLSALKWCRPAVSDCEESVFSIWTKDATEFHEPTERISVGLWTLLQLSIQSDDKAKTSKYLKPWFQFIIEGIPIVPTPLRSWVLQSALSDVLLEDGSRSDNDDCREFVKIQILQALVSRSLLFIKQKKTAGKPSSMISVDRVFTVSSSRDKADPSEDCSAVFKMMFLLVKNLSKTSQSHAGFYEKIFSTMLSEICQQTRFETFMDIDRGADNDATRSDLASSDTHEQDQKEDDSRMEQMERHLILCARIIASFANDASGVNEFFVPGKETLGKVFNDSIMAISIASAEKRMKEGSIQPVILDHCRHSLRRNLVDGLLQLLLSIDFENQRSRTRLLGACCHLIATGRRLDKAMGKKHFHNFDNVRDRHDGLLAKSFPRFISLALSSLASMMSQYQQLRSQIGSTTFSLKAIEDACICNAALASTCTEVQSALKCNVFDPDEISMETFCELLELYDLICSNQGIVFLSTVVINRQIENVGIDSMEALFPGIDCSGDAELIARGIRKRVLFTMHQLMLAFQDGNTSHTVVMNAADLQRFGIQVLSKCARDVGEGLKGNSGGLSMSEFSSFLQCMESSCTLISFLAEVCQDINFDNETMTILIAVSELAEDVLNSIMIRNRSIFKRTIRLFLRVIPAIIEKFLWNDMLPSEIKSNSMRTKTQSGKIFEQCYRILIQTKERPPSLITKWSDIVDAGHLQSALLDDLNADASDDIGNDKILEAGDEIGSTNQALLQLDSERPWIWAFCCLLDSYGEALDESLGKYLVHDPIRSRRSLNDVQSYFSIRKVLYDEVFKCSHLLLGRNDSLRSGSDTLAASLPSSIKSAFRLMLEKAIKALAHSLDLLCKREIESTDGYRCAEAYACIVSWLSTNAVSEDLCHGIRLWYNAEVNIFNRLKREDNILVMNKNSVVKSLERIIPTSHRIEELLETLHVLSKDSQTNKKSFETWECYGQFSISEMVTSKLNQLQTSRSINLDDLKCTTPSALRKSTVIRKRRSRGSSKPPSKRKREQITQSRSNIVRAWLNMDKVMGEETHDEDAFADLEDFLAEG